LAANGDELQRGVLLLQPDEVITAHEALARHR
jgi:hypothetical protein